jgi:hypothetical protein
VKEYNVPPGGTLERGLDEGKLVRIVLQQQDVVQECPVRTRVRVSLGDPRSTRYHTITYENPPGRALLWPTA